MAPKVSVLIPCFNAERWIGQAIDSALAQTYPHKEVVVVDDGSSDNSPAIIQSYGDRIRFEAGPNRGGNRARNRLLELSEGDWLQYLDADDYLSSGKVAAQIAFLADEGGDVDIVYGPVTIEHFSEAGSRFELSQIPEPRDAWVLLARWFLPQTGSPLWRKQAIVDVGGWKPNQPCCQEHELYLRLLMAGKRFAYCEAGGAVYRHWSEDTVCRRDVPEVNMQRLEIKRRIQEFLCSRGALTPERLSALNIARFEIARAAWRYDKRMAQRIIRHIRASQPAFLPVNTPAAPLAYQLMYRLVGFSAAESLADVLRRLPVGA